MVNGRSVNSLSDSTGNGINANLDDELATGSTGALTFVPEGEEPIVAPGALEAPANLIVQDWLGSDGNGDQGGFVSVAFPAADGASRFNLKINP